MQSKQHGKPTKDANRDESMIPQPPPPPQDENCVQPAAQKAAVMPYNGHHGRMYPAVDLPLSQCPTNLDLATPRGRAMALAAGNPGDIDLGKDGLAEIVATHFLIFSEERPDVETGELHTFARTVLFTKDGQTFRTTSAHVPHKIQQVCELFTPEEWAAGITFVIRERKSKRDMFYHDIRLKV